MTFSSFSILSTSASLDETFSIFTSFNTPSTIPVPANMSFSSQIITSVISVLSAVSSVSSLLIPRIPDISNTLGRNSITAARTAITIVEIIKLLFLI